MTARRFDLREDLWWIVAVLGALLLLNGAFYIFFNLPRVRARQALEEGRNEARRTVRLAGERCQAMRDLVAHYDEETGRLEDFYTNRLGTQTDRMISIQKEVRAIASEFRIDPESIDYNPTPVEGTDLTRFEITIPLVGGYPNLRQFIDRIETSQHLLIVDSVELTGAKEGGAMLSLTIKIATYFRSPERPSGRAAPAAA
ncbi:MAG TPA: GspMb/PilO family protein [Candidatus Polarisedimenticolia bacterium]|nr:GspMb/PilO family protein [Candidatus Polarisedimenticolia bacterium]